MAPSCSALSWYYDELDSVTLFEKDLISAEIHSIGLVKVLNFRNVRSTGAMLLLQYLRMGGRGGGEDLQ